MTRDLEGTLVRFSPSRRSRGSWLTLARILPRASSAVETADLRHRTRTPHSASGWSCPSNKFKGSHTANFYTKVATQAHPECQSYRLPVSPECQFYRGIGVTRGVLALPVPLDARTADDPAGFTECEITSDGEPARCGSSVWRSLRGRVAPGILYCMYGGGDT